MRNRLFIILVAVSVTVGCNVPDNSATAQSMKVTPERLGNPFLNKPVYSRNVWDLTVFDGKLWLGHGDSAANTGSRKDVNGQRLGTVVWHYTLDGGFATTPVDGARSALGGVDEEQVDRFVITGGKMYIPGHDPISSDDWSRGNYYVYDADAGRFAKRRELPDGVHAYDMIEVDGNLYAALGSAVKARKGQINLQGLGHLAVVRPQGQARWKTAGFGGNTDTYVQSGNVSNVARDQTGKPLLMQTRMRAYELFMFGDEVYLAEASKGFADNDEFEGIDLATFQPTTLNNRSAFQVEGGSARFSKLDRDTMTFKPTDLSINDIYPNAARRDTIRHITGFQDPANPSLANTIFKETEAARGDDWPFSGLDFPLDGSALGHRPLRPTEFAGKLVYIGGISNNDHQYITDSAYVATPGFAEVNAVPLTPSVVGNTVLPWDLEVVGDTLYLLASERLGKDNYRVSLWSTEDAEAWTEVAWFKTSTFARSLAYYNGAFYFGLGSLAGDVSPATGDILRLNATVIPEPGSLALLGLGAVALLRSGPRRECR